jgi:uncharacterized membrane-anchored protein
MNRQTLFFILAIIVQLVILAAVPAKNIYTRATGKSIILKMRPVDPYNILSGYYVTLNFEISNPESFTGEKNYSSGQAIYAVLEKRSDGIWHPVSLSDVLPSWLSDNHVAIRGSYSSMWIKYGIEEFYIPEDKRREIDRELRENRDQGRVEIKLDSRGNAALVRLLIGERVYDY